MGFKNGKVHISLILAVFVMVSHHFLLNSGYDCKEDGDKEQERDNSRLYLKVGGQGKERASRGHGPTCSPGGQYGNLLPNLFQVVSLNLETMSYQKGFISLI